MRKEIENICEIFETLKEMTRSHLVDHAYNEFRTTLEEGELGNGTIANAAYSANERIHHAEYHMYNITVIGKARELQRRLNELLILSRG